MLAIFIGIKILYENVSIKTNKTNYCVEENEMPTTFIDRGNFQLWVR